ncbi:hypothetical protein BGZ61DRAFT_587562 [Ilyonectria robusta]|uniref:uncharacterized protein n=1 Tax=Ilyonectria robusta TaxID=1079257 RepID=UPI001E8EB162|nr:uncharacterized protein BGZ61DRAFT_587562 [Ilyonectria robusta]KAH8706341.1 hypothetical protein BGZ61DRAFT_587562 [Ilyonectria robusta]
MHLPSRFTFTFTFTFHITGSPLLSGTLLTMPRGRKGSQQGEPPELPDPDTDILQSMNWMDVDVAYLSADNRALHNNLGTIARPLTAVLQAIQTQADTRTRSQSVTSRRSVNTEEGEDAKEELEMEDSSQKQLAFRNQLKEYVDIINKYHQLWIQDSEVIMYLHFNKEYKAGAERQKKSSLKGKGKDNDNDNAVEPHTPRHVSTTTSAVDATDRSSYSPSATLFASGGRSGRPAVLGSATTSGTLGRGTLGRGRGSSPFDFPTRGALAVSGSGSKRLRLSRRSGVVISSDSDLDEHPAKRSGASVAAGDSDDDDDDLPVLEK